ncbi:MAG: HD domain-containing protein [Myxococcota bacterium]|nr:HD domain-containing protein [Myxococcota bacterium]
MERVDTWTSVAQVRTRISRDPGLTALEGALLEQLDGDPGHDHGHVLRVALWTLRIGEGDVDEREGIAAALLHDLVNVPKDSPMRNKASELSAEAAEPLLRAQGFDPEAVTRIRDAIRDHSFSRGATPTSPLGRALQDADRLEAVGAIGVFRTISTGARMGATYFHAADPWAESRDLDDRSHTVDHFFAKLLLLPETMCTARGTAEARRRGAFMTAFLGQLGEELGIPLTNRS